MSKLAPRLPKQKDKILLGLRRLDSRAKPGQTFTHAEIARECGVWEGAVRKIEKQAMERLKAKLANASPEARAVLHDMLNA